MLVQVYNSMVFVILLHYNNLYFVNIDACLTFVLLHKFNMKLILIQWLVLFFYADCQKTVAQTMTITELTI